MFTYTALLGTAFKWSFNDILSILGFSRIEYWIRQYVLIYLHLWMTTSFYSSNRCLSKKVYIHFQATDTSMGYCLFTKCLCSDSVVFWTSVVCILANKSENQVSKDFVLYTFLRYTFIGVFCVFHFLVHLWCVLYYIRYSLYGLIKILV